MQKILIILMLFSFGTANAEMNNLQKLMHTKANERLFHVKCELTYIDIIENNLKEVPKSVYEKKAEEQCNKMAKSFESNWFAEDNAKLDGCHAGVVGAMTDYEKKLGSANDPKAFKIYYGSQCLL